MAKFLTSARAVDMLGRQQIAGIPTAVSEIFKNAYDAYALSVRGDYFPGRKILSIRDDGIGMDYEDFVTRWLTIGTDSKARDSSKPLPPAPPGFKARRQMGEKGIGRLAIASVGSQMLLITRAREKIGTPRDEWTVALLQWSQFEIPGVTLDDVVIPVRRLQDISELNVGLLRELSEEVTEAIRKLGDRVSGARKTRIESELAALSYDPQSILRLNGPDVTTTGGTAFIVCPANDDLESVVLTTTSPEDEFVVSPFQRFLMGFTNTITESSPSVDFSTEFILHDKAGPKDLIDPASFWRPEDFNYTDHTVEGEFDEYGTFTGEVSVYGGNPVKVMEPYPKKQGNATSCGRFKLKFGYVQGHQSGSRLSGEDFALMAARLQRLGGLYIYRDGIRVLPYGNSDTDFLEMEHRRSLNAGRYYFSYRRIFGAIEISSDANSGLQEKAGREGFRENAAYRDFREVLKNFLVQLAANFFSGSSPDADDFRLQRERLKGRSVARASAEKAEQQMRMQLADTIEERLNEFESGRFSMKASSVVEQAYKELGAVAGSLNDRDLRDLRQRALNDLNKLLQDFDVKKPAGLGLTIEQDRSYGALQKARSAAAEYVGAAAQELDLLFQDFGIVYGSLEDSPLDEIKRRGKSELRALESAAGELSAGVRALISETVSVAQGEVQKFSEYLNHLIDGLPTVLSATEELAILNDLRKQAEVRRANLDELGKVMATLRSGSSFLDDRAQLQERVLDLQDQVEGNLELMQLGQAVQIVSHEFETSIRSIRSGLQKLSPWARSTPRLLPVVKDLRASFAHLDGYLRLFTPLQRRLYRQKVTITGNQIAEFVSGVFQERFERHSVEFVVTDAFRRWKFEGFPSTFYPVFINLVDNSVSWAAMDRSSPVVTLDADHRGLLVRDNGPGVRLRDREAIFERGFTRRRGGRGLGLPLARQLLARDGWMLQLDPETGVGLGATFRLEPIDFNFDHDKEVQ